MSPKTVLLLCAMTTVAVGTLALFLRLFRPPQTAVPSSIATISVAPTQLPTVEPSRSMVSFQASFAIFTNGTFRTFSSPMYLNQSTDVFLEAINPNIIQIRKNNVTWEQFFSTLPFSITPTCIVTGTNESFCTTEQKVVRFFLNGTENPQLLTLPIQPNDRVLITYGVTTEEEVRQQYRNVPTL